MSVGTGEASNRGTVIKRGRKSEGQREAEVVESLRHLHDLEWLDDCSLADHPAFRQAAGRDRILGKGRELRSALLKVIALTVEALKEAPGYENRVEYLEGYSRGDSVAKIAKTIGIRRENVFRTHSPKALGLVARNFLKFLRNSELNSE